jgi:flagellar M-ring protein FliF
LTAAIVVNDRLIQASTSKSGAQWQARSADELRNLTALAQAAVGFDSTRNDVVTVQDLPFEENQAKAPTSVATKIVTGAENSPLLVKYLSMLIGIVAVITMGIRPALRKAGRGSHDLTLSTTGSAPAMMLHSEAVAPDPSRARTQEIFDQVTNQLKQEPARSSRLLQSWIHSE